MASSSKLKLSLQQVADRHTANLIAELHKQWEASTEIQLLNARHEASIAGEIRGYTRAQRHFTALSWWERLTFNPAKGLR